MSSKLFEHLSIYLKIEDNYLGTLEIQKNVCLVLVLNRGGKLRVKEPVKAAGEKEGEACFEAA